MPHVNGKVATVEGQRRRTTRFETRSVNVSLARERRTTSSLSSVKDNGEFRPRRLHHPRESRRGPATPPPASRRPLPSRRHSAPSSSGDAIRPGTNQAIRLEPVRRLYGGVATASPSRGSQLGRHLGDFLRREAALYSSTWLPERRMTVASNSSSAVNGKVVDGLEWPTAATTTHGFEDALT